MSQVQQLKDAVDIVQIIGERIKLTRSGSSYKGLCPFHSEKTPSFFVSEQLQRYRCFGCGETGDVINFLQKYDGMTFAEALQYLSDRTGIKLKEYQRTAEDDLRDRLLAALDLAKEYYHYLLTKHTVGKPALTYLKERKISQASIDLFQLGFAPSGWDGLIQYLHGKKKYALAELQQAGLIIRGTGGRYYDRFRGRVIFPLKDHRGRVVGFSGRLLDANPKEAKYINTPETLLYHKSHLLYGLKELFAEIKKKEQVIVVEGEFDVIASAQAHVNNIVAIKGSALTRDHAKLLARLVKKVILCLDADAAGAEATKRAIEVIGDLELELRVIDLSSLENGAKDVDELVKNDAQSWRQLAEQSISVYEFLLQLALRQYDASAPEGKREIVKAVGPVISQIPHAVERDFYIKKLAAALEVQPDLVLQDLSRLRGGGSVSSQDKKVEQEASQTDSRREKLEKYALFLLFELKDLAKHLSELEQIVFKTPGLETLVKNLVKKTAQGTTDLRALSAGLGEDLKQLMFDIVYSPEFASLKKTIQEEKEWSRTLRDLQQENRRGEIQLLQEKIAGLERKTNRTTEEETALNEALRQVVVLQQQTR